MLLTSENIEFYSQRRKQYTQDFLKLTNQFKPKLQQLQRRLIAQKQIIDGPVKIQSTTQKYKKFSRVLLSLSKSKEVQNKIDKEMNRCTYQYELDEALNCKFNYSQTCKKIQQSMFPLIENIQVQIKEKHQELMTNPDDLIQCQKREELEKIKLKSRRYFKIIEKLQKMDIQKQQQITNEKLSFKNLEKLDQIQENEEILKYSEKPITSRRTLESSMQQDEDKKNLQTTNNSQIGEESNKNLQIKDLDHIIRKHQKKMGLLNRKQQSMMEFKNFIYTQRTINQENLNQQNEIRYQQSKQKIPSNKRFSQTFLSTKINSSNLTPIFDEQNGIITCITAKNQKNISLQQKKHQKQQKSLKLYHEAQETKKSNKLFQYI
ncbi:unnamed protein product [Paramecium sonneborni]|uniref:Uncharacterized protein n=1 Tax=Paramecium sonneborni TaxID=65129 RepID=A0A8S1KA96_9CILI|nr:unnamed protein product [Paramecium sonneborni]